jgi:hypothetical protein
MLFIMLKTFISVIYLMFSMKSYFSLLNEKCNNSIGESFKRTFLIIEKFMEK